VTTVKAGFYTEPQDLSPELPMTVQIVTELVGVSPAWFFVITDEDPIYLHAAFNFALSFFSLFYHHHC